MRRGFDSSTEEFNQANGFSVMRETDGVIRQFTVNKTGPGEVKEMMQVMDEIFSKALKGQLLQIAVSSLNSSEVNSFFNQGMQVFGEVDFNISSRTISKELQKLLDNKFFSSRIASILESQLEGKVEYEEAIGYQHAYLMFYWPLLYLSKTRTVTYSDLTTKRDLPVNARIKNRQSNWWINLTAEHIFRKIDELGNTVLKIDDNPNSILDAEKKVLELCHFIAVVSKWGLIANGKQRLVTP